MQVIIVIFIILISEIAVAETDNCNAVLEIAAKNTFEQNISAENWNRFRQYLLNDDNLKEIQNRSGGGGGSIDILGIVKMGGSGRNAYEDAKRWRKLFEKSDSGENFSKEDIKLLSQTVEKSAVEAWLACTELNKKDLFFSVYEQPEGKGVVIKIADKRDGNGRRLTGIWSLPENAFICEGEIGNSRTETVNKHTRAELKPGAYTITCYRNFQEKMNHYGRSYKVAEKASLVISVNDSGKPFKMEFPAYNDNIEEDIKKLQEKIAMLEKQIPKIYKTSAVVNSYYACNGNINPKGEFKIDFPKDYFSKTPEIMLAIRGWTYYGGDLSTDPNKLKQASQDHWAFLQMGASWAKVSEVTKDYCKIQIYLHEARDAPQPGQQIGPPLKEEWQFNNQFLLDMLAVSN